MSTGMSSSKNHNEYVEDVFLRTLIIVSFFQAEKYEEAKKELKELLRHVKGGTKDIKLRDDTYLSHGRNAAMDEKVLSGIMRAFDACAQPEELNPYRKSFRKISSQLWLLVDGWKPFFALELAYALIGVEPRVEYHFTQKHLKEAQEIKEKLFS